MALKATKPARDMNQIAARIGDADLKGQTVVVRLNCLAAQFRTGDRRLLCTSGPGCRLSGKAIYGTFRGEPDVRFDRTDIQGLAAHPLARPKIKPTPTSRKG